MTFHRGMKVVCLDASNWDQRGYGDDVYPEEGGIYTVRDVVVRLGILGLLLEEIRNDRLPYLVDGKIEDAEKAFSARRFKPVVEGQHKRELEAA